METVVIEERIYKSGKNIRSLLLDVRKACADMNTTSTFMEFKSNEDAVKVKEIDFLHIHSNEPVVVSLKANGQSMTYVTSFLTLQGRLDQVVVAGCCEEGQDTIKPAQTFIVYATK